MVRSKSRSRTTSVDRRVDRLPVEKPRRSLPGTTISYKFKMSGSRRRYSHRSSGECRRLFTRMSRVRSRPGRGSACLRTWRPLISTIGDPLLLLRMEQDRIETDRRLLIPLRDEISTCMSQSCNSCVGVFKQSRSDVTTPAPGFGGAGRSWIGTLTTWISAGRLRVSDLCPSQGTSAIASTFTLPQPGRPMEHLAKGWYPWATFVISGPSSCPARPPFDF
jgi:hypothetical protein